MATYIISSIINGFVLLGFCGVQLHVPPSQLILNIIYKDETHDRATSRVSRLKRTKIYL